MWLALVVLAIVVITTLVVLRTRAQRRRLELITEMRAEMAAMDLQILEAAKGWGVHVDDGASVQEVIGRAQESVGNMAAQAMNGLDDNAVAQLMLQAAGDDPEIMAALDGLDLAAMVKRVPLTAVVLLPETDTDSEVSVKAELINPLLDDACSQASERPAVRVEDLAEHATQLQEAQADLPPEEAPRWNAARGIRLERRAMLMSLEQGASAFNETVERVLEAVDGVAVYFPSSTGLLSRREYVEARETYPPVMLGHVIVDEQREVGLTTVGLKALDLPDIEMPGGGDIETLSERGQLLYEIANAMAVNPSAKDQLDGYTIDDVPDGPWRCQSVAGGERLELVRLSA